MIGRSPIMVTGGAGFIGSHACKALAAAGHVPVTLDNLSTGHRDAVKWGPLVVADVRDTCAVQRALRMHGVQLVMHFAASAYVGESVRDPALYYSNNTGGMISLLEACRAAGVNQAVFSSSCATYGVPSCLPVSETAPQLPVSPYGYSKLTCEQMLRDYAAAYGLRSVILRYFNAAGADPAGELRERHDPETHLIPLALMAASGRRGPLEIFGTDYATRDGSCERDYIHVSDLARGHVLAAEYLLSGGAGTALNLGSGTGHTVFEVLEAIRLLTGRPVPYRTAPRRPGDPEALTADPRRAREVLGFETRLSDLGQIIRDAAPGSGLRLLSEEARHGRKRA
ncbi:UDP-glucose 4-epimerase GalE [Roseobacteraceae bacterium NS-SX3]